MKVRPTIVITFLIICLIPFSIILINTVQKDPTTPLEAAKLPPPDYKDTYIIFLPGMNTWCDGTMYNQMGFEELRRQLTRADLSYQDEHYLMYSYRGGKMQAGRWYPTPYNPIDTGQPITFSVHKLREMIEEFNRYNPGARFLLVGHSFGGKIAFDYVAKYYSKDPGPIKGVITLNSPLLGTHYSHIEIFATIKPVWGTPAVKQLSAEYQYRNELDILTQKMDAARRMNKEGIYLATFGTKQDIIVHPNSACLTDRSGRPLTEGYIVSVNEFPADFCDLFGHRQVMNNQKVVDCIISAYTSP